MKRFILAFFIGGMFVASGQNQVAPERYTAHNKGKFFVFWGGNRGYYTKSDITFSGENYKFTLSDVQAVDRPKGWHIDYINPLRLTIPQTNARIGYFINDHYALSIGVDHMKYVMNQDQVVPISGYIKGMGTPHDGTYSAVNKKLTEDFLTFEHTDGLNYVTLEFSRVDDISHWFGVKNTDIFQVNLTEGVGIGALYPKTNTKLLNQPRYDEFHWSGYGSSVKGGLHLVFFKHFMVIGELKGGYIWMNDIRTTANKADKASQDFFFFQTILALGGVFRF